MNSQTLADNVVNVVGRFNKWKRRLETWLSDRDQYDRHGTSYICFSLIPTYAGVWTGGARLMLLGEHNGHFESATDMWEFVEIEINGTIFVEWIGESRTLKGKLYRKIKISL